MIIVEKELNGRETVIFTVLLPVMSVGCSIGINYLENKIGLVTTLVILVTILIIIAVSIYCGTIVYFNIGKDALETQIDLEIKEIQ